jgi:hypothetical protein
LSAASPWEIAIKSRLGKLRLKPRLDALPDFLVSLGITILSINERQAPTAIDPGTDRALVFSCGGCQNCIQVRVTPAVSGSVSDLRGAGVYRRTLAKDTHSIRWEGINSDDAGGKRNHLHEVTLYVWG